MASYINSNDIPFGLVADKMTSKHLTRHMVGIRIPIWDIRYIHINKDIYVQCSCIQDVTGKGVTQHMLKSLESFGMDSSYQRKNLSGCAMDGQYIHLHVVDHLKCELLKDYHITWDPTHRIELSIKDCYSKKWFTQFYIENGFYS